MCCGCSPKKNSRLSWAVDQMCAWRMQTSSRSVAAAHVPSICIRVSTRRQHTLQCRSSAATGQQQQESAAAAAAAAAATSIRQLLTRRSYAPVRYVGPIEVSHIPGKRFGLTATRNLAVGELLLVSTPLAVAFGPAGEAPSNEALLQQLEGAQLQPWQLNWLRALNREPPPAAAAAAAGHTAAGSTAAGEPGPQQQDEEQHQQQQTRPATADRELLLLPLLQQLLLQGPAQGEGPLPVVPTGGGPSPGPPELSITSVQCPLSTEQLQQVISGNAYSEAAEDLGACLLRELDPEGVTGLYPEYSLLNHSCAPNTLAMCVGQYLLLHVTGSVLAGDELTCSYLGPRAFSPVAERRAFLQGVYGFHCTCNRCIAEQRTFPTQYYPADDHILGLTTSSSSSSGVLGAAVNAFRAVTGAGQAQGSAAAPGQRPNPSPQHRMLQQQYEAVHQQLRPAVQAAATADSRRQEQQLQLLGQVTDAVDSVYDAVAAAVAGDAALVGQAAAAAKWLLAAVYPLLQLQLELLELLLASGDLPVDESQLLLDDGAPYVASSSSSRAMSAAGAAAAARFALNPTNKSRSRRRRQQQQQRSRSGGLGRWLTGLWASVTPWGGSSSSQAGGGGPVTKRQLLAFYAEVLGRALGVLDAVARGSEAHVVAAIKHMDAVRQCVGVDAEETVLAEGLCARAHAARYGVQRGPEGQALLVRLTSARRRQLLGASLARKMSVLAWEDATTRV